MFQIQGRWVDGWSFCYPWLRPEKQRGVPQVSALNLTWLNSSSDSFDESVSPDFAELLGLRQDEVLSRLLTLIKSWKAEEFAAGDCLKPDMIEFSILILEMNPWAQILQDYLVLDKTRCSEGCCLCALLLSIDLSPSSTFIVWTGLLFCLISLYRCQKLFIKIAFHSKMGPHSMNYWS